MLLKEIYNFFYENSVRKEKYNVAVFEASSEAFRMHE